VEPTLPPVLFPDHVEIHRDFKSAAEALREYVRLAEREKVIFKYGEDETFVGWLVRVSRNRLLVHWEISPLTTYAFYYTLIPIVQVDLQTLYYWPTVADGNTYRLVPHVSGEPPIHGISQATIPREMAFNTEDKWLARMDEMGFPKPQFGQASK
jgi:hypothetical protein